MRQINRRTGKLSGNYKRHLKKVSCWDYGRSMPMLKGWIGQRKESHVKPMSGTMQIGGVKGEVIAVDEFETFKEISDCSEVNVSEELK